YPLGTFYGPKFLGVDATGKQVFLCTTANTGTSCVNGRTTTGGGPDAADYQVIGNANPDLPWVSTARSTGTGSRSASWSGPPSDRTCSTIPRWSTPRRATRCRTRTSCGPR